MWSNNKACLAQVEGNVVFNGKRKSLIYPLLSLRIGTAAALIIVMRRAKSGHQFQCGSPTSLEGSNPFSWSCLSVSG
jgi:hypothetical protein